MAGDPTKPRHKRDTEVSKVGFCSLRRFDVHRESGHVFRLAGWNRNKLNGIFMMSEPDSFHSRVFFGIRPKRRPTVKEISKELTLKNGTLLRNDLLVLQDVLKRKAIGRMDERKARQRFL
jgi:hypothetical protein